MQVSKVLVVDGDRAARDALVTCLQFVGVEAHGADCADSAQFWLSRDAADVIVLSDEVHGSLAELMGHRARQADAAAASILVLSRDGVARRLPPNYHCDVMLRRPVAVSRVVERVELLIDQRRNAGGVRLMFGELILDVVAARATVGERWLDLGRTEARLLAFFMGLPDRVFSRVQVLQRLWPAGVRVQARTVDVHIRRLRAALAELGCADYIQTVRGSGYRFSRRSD